jgi:predicted nucleic acid-binding protein
MVGQHAEGMTPSNEPGDPLRIYADSSVFGGAFDDEFADASRAFFDRARRGDFRLVVSSVVESEIQSAPPGVRRLFEEFKPTAELAPVSDEALTLRDAYIEAGIVSRKSLTDALHVALASTARCSLIVSWNFAHIVHFARIPRYNAVNTAQGHGTIAIHSPLEVVANEDEDF